MENKLYVSPSPHIHGGDSISKNMYGVLIALVPAFLVSLYFFGLGALIVTVASVFFCVLFGLRTVRISDSEVPDEKGTDHLRWFGHPDRRFAGVQPAVKPTDLDHRHRCTGSHRYR